MHFDAEHIIVDVRGPFLEVTGTYHFTYSGTHAQPTLLWYPYPEDSLLGAARTLRLEYQRADGSWQPIPFDDRPPRGARWRLPAVDSTRLSVRTVYRQVMRTTYARYIVTTTQAWGEPIRQATFEIRLPAGARRPTFSYPFQSVGPSVRVWRYSATSFLPQEDIIVRYEM